MVTVLQGLKHTHTHTHYISSRFKTHTDITFLQGLKHTHYISSRFKTHTQTHIHTRTRTHTHTHTHTGKGSHHQSRTSISLPERQAFNPYF